MLLQQALPLVLPAFALVLLPLAVGLLLVPCIQRLLASTVALRSAERRRRTSISAAIRARAGHDAQIATAEKPMHGRRPTCLDKALREGLDALRHAFHDSRTSEERVAREVTMAVHRSETNDVGVFGRVVGSIPKYREEATRLASRIRDSLPPVMLAHRIEAVERRLDSIETKVDEILRRLEKH